MSGQFDLSNCPDMLIIAGGINPFTTFDRFFEALVLRYTGLLTFQFNLSE